MSNYCKNCYELIEKLEAKEQECEQEKALKETYLACYKAKHEDIKGALFKLKQTLTEIKEIAEKEVKHAPDGETFTRPEIKQVLQKISECEVENAR